MTWQQMAVWVLALWGNIYLVTQSAILRVPRILFARGSWLRTEWVYCPSCTGFWLGMLLCVPYVRQTGRWDVVPYSAMAAVALGRIWGAWFGEDTFANERPLLQLPGDDHDQTEAT
jgi:hypothetical protein